MGRRRHSPRGASKRLIGRAVGVLVALASAGCSHDWDALLYAGGGAGGTGGSGGGAAGAGGSAWLQHDWSHVYTVGIDESASNALGLAVAPDDQIGLAGSFVTDVNLGNQILSSAGSDDIFVARFSPGGAAVSGHAYGDGSFLQAATGVAIDATGALVVAGMTTGEVDLGGGPLTATGLDAFVARYDASGAHAWSHLFGDAGNDAAAAVAVDPSGEAFVVGGFEQQLGALPAGCSLVPSAQGGSDIFVIKLKQSGACAWVRTFGSVGGNEAVVAAAVDATRVLITGSFDAPMTIDDQGGGPLDPLGTDVFVAALSATTGDVQWSHRYGDAAEQRGTAVALAPDGGVLVAGVLSGTPDFGGGPLDGDDAGDGFVMRLDAAGQHVWSVALGDGAAQAARAVAVDDQQHAWVAGGFAGSIVAGSTVLTADKTDVFLVELGADGAPLHAASWGDAFDGQEATDVALDASGAVLVAGLFRGSMDFGGGALVSNAPQQVRDLFLAKLLVVP